MIHYALTSCQFDLLRGPNYRKPPINSIGSLDMRSLPDHAGTEFLFCALDDSIIPIDRSYRVIATAPSPVHDLSIAVTPQNRIVFADAIGVTLTGSINTLADLLAAAYLAGDPEGQTALRPLSGLGGEFSIYLAGHSKVWSRTVARGNRDDPFRAKALMVDRVELLKVTDPVLRGKLITDRLANGGFEISRAAAKELFGIDEEPLPRRTSYTDDFTRANNAALGGNWSEPEGGGWSIDSNQANGGGASSDNSGRYDLDVSSANHITTFTLKTIDTLNGAPGPTCRHSASAETFYYSYNGSATATTSTWKQVAGTHTQVGTSTAYTSITNDTASIRAAGDAITRYINGSSQQANTDTAISGGTRGGMYFYAWMGSVDDWIVDDEASGTRPVKFAGQWGGFAGNGGGFAA